jgi:CheY-like chemotaxis protein
MTPRILLASDIPDHVPHYESALLARGYAVTVSPSGVDALPRAISEQPACIIIDERVSNMGGWDLCKRLRADLRVRMIPVIMLTQYVACPEAIGTQRTGCNSWLAMPTTGEDLVEAVEYVLTQGTNAPVSDRDALIGQMNCPACESTQIRAALRVGLAQYYFCQSCGFYWRDAPHPLADSSAPS